MTPLEQLKSLLPAWERFGTDYTSGGQLKWFAVEVMCNIDLPAIIAHIESLEQQLADANILLGDAWQDVVGIMAGNPSLETALRAQLAKVTGDVLVLRDELADAKAEIERLKGGRFTPDELQNLCPNLSDGDYKEFCDGCDDYQRKLFGRCRTDERVQYAADCVSRYAEFEERLRRVENQNPMIGGVD